MRTFPTRRPRGGPAALTTGLRRRGVGFWPKEGSSEDKWAEGRVPTAPSPSCPRRPPSPPQGARARWGPSQHTACTHPRPQRAARSTTRRRGSSSSSPPQRSGRPRRPPWPRAAVPALHPPPPAGLCSRLPAWGQLAFHFQFTLQPWGDPSAAGASSPRLWTHTRAGPAIPPGCGAKPGPPPRFSWCLEVSTAVPIRGRRPGPADNTQGEWGLCLSEEAHPRPLDPPDVSQGRLLWPREGEGVPPSEAPQIPTPAPPHKADTAALPCPARGLGGRLLTCGPGTRRQGP